MTDGAEASDGLEPPPPDIIVATQYGQIDRCVFVHFLSQTKIFFLVERKLIQTINLQCSRAARLRHACHLRAGRRLYNSALGGNQQSKRACSVSLFVTTLKRFFSSRLYLERGADPNAIGGILSATPLHWAARQGHLSICVMLLDAGADPTIFDCEGKHY